MCVSVPFKIFFRVFEFDSMLLQEGIYFHARLVPHQLPELSDCNFAFVVSRQRQGFERTAGQVVLPG